MRGRDLRAWMRASAWKWSRVWLVSEGGDGVRGMVGGKGVGKGVVKGVAGGVGVCEGLGIRFPFNVAWS